MGNTINTIQNYDQTTNSIASKYRFLKHQDQKNGFTYLCDRATAKQYILKQYTTMSKNQFQLLQQRLIRKKQQSHPHILNLKEFISKSDNQLCSTIFKTYAIIQFPFRNLYQQISDRKNNKDFQFFQQNQIWSILYSCCLAIQHLFTISNQLNMLCSSSIFIEKDGIIKIGDPYLVNSKTPLKTNHQHFYSTPRNQTYSKESAQIFTLGMILLETIHLNFMDDIYQSWNKIRQEKLRQKIQKIRSRYSSKLQNIINKMLSVDQRSRIKLVQIIRIIQKDDFQEQIKQQKQKNKKFIPVSVSQKSNIIPYHQVHRSQIYQAPITQPLIFPPKQSVPVNLYPINNSMYESYNMHKNQSIPIKYEYSNFSQQIPYVQQKQHQNMQINYSIPINNINNGNNINGYTNVYNHNHTIYPSNGFNINGCVNSGQNNPNIYNGYNNMYNNGHNYAYSNNQILNNQKKYQNLEIIGQVPLNININNNNGLTEKRVQQFNKLKNEQIDKNKQIINEILPQRKKINIFKKQVKLDKNIEKINQNTEIINLNILVQTKQIQKFKQGQQERQILEKKQKKLNKNKDQLIKKQNNQKTGKKISQNQKKQTINDQIKNKIDKQNQIKSPKKQIQCSQKTQTLFKINNSDNKQSNKPLLTLNPNQLNDNFTQSYCNQSILLSNRYPNAQPIYVQQQYEFGSKYIGYKLNGMRHGFGTFYYQDGGYYQGQWKQNRMSGFAKLYYQNGDIAYEGSWLDDQFHGKGKIFNDNPVAYLGPFNYADFTILQDFWIYYSGQFISDSKHGNGQIRLTNGQVFQGHFQDDAIDGPGKFYCLNGLVIDGIWKNNKLINRMSTQNSEGQRMEILQVIEQQ